MDLTEYERVAEEFEALQILPFELKCSVVYDAYDQHWVIVVHAVNLKDSDSVEIPKLGAPKGWKIDSYWYPAGGASGMIGSVFKE